MAFAVLGSGPTYCRIRPPRHFPPIVTDMLAAQMDNFAGTLAGEQNELEGDASLTGFAKSRPEFRHLARRQHPLAAVGRVTLDMPARIEGDAGDFLAQRPGKYCRS